MTTCRAETAHPPWPPTFHGPARAFPSDRSVAIHPFHPVRQTSFLPVRAQPTTHGNPSHADFPSPHSTRATSQPCTSLSEPSPADYLRRSSPVLTDFPMQCQPSPDDYARRAIADQPRLPNPACHDSSRLTDQTLRGAVPADYPRRTYPEPGRHTAPCPSRRQPPDKPH